MRDFLAERLLAEVMNWSPEDIARERPDLQALATKYDEYQQFAPGMRFIESLAVWLGQFRELEERQLAYQFVRERLFFLSNSEMIHLVSVAYPDFIRPFLIRKTASQLAIPERFIKKISDSMEFKVLLRQSLFVGLSDGAQIGVFRRSNPHISNEQVLLSYDISKEKVVDSTTELHNELQKMLGRELTERERGFTTIFLLDDFSGSGLSCMRKNADGSYSGKVTKILNELFFGGLKDLVSVENIQVCMVLYIASERARQYLERIANNWISEKDVDCSFSIFVIQEIPEAICISEGRDKQFVNLLIAYFDESIVDKHYRVGLHGQPYFGFDGCALPLVLSHNTPNNSIPLLWYGEKSKFNGLFPRISRHREEKR